ncbi:MAG: hypothetical protein HY319_15360 [Armatimonadetes bacterium]|nr:hypothetical protein [Armatimonadota bacterium]
MKGRDLFDWAVRLLVALLVLGPVGALALGAGAWFLAIPALGLGQTSWPSWLLCAAAGSAGFGLGCYLSLNGGGRKLPVPFNRTRRCQGCGHWNEPGEFFCEDCSRPLVTLGDRRRELSGR